MTDYLHKEFPKTVGKTEFWKQIKRTVNGHEVSESNISLIIDQVTKHLKLELSDDLLDFGCGNGALASRLFPLINRYTGVDFSEYLLEIAAEYFQPSANVIYYLDDIVNFLDSRIDNMSPNKVLIYGVMSYLTREEVSYMFTKLAQKESIERVFIGNIPNKAHSKKFFEKRDIADFDLNDAKSPIGVWWDTSELSKVAENVNFQTEVTYMPGEFYGAEYRFDLVLERK